MLMAEAEVNKDQLRFAPVAFRSAVKKSFLVEKESTTDWRRRFFALFGNLLFKYDGEDSDRCCGIEFMEYANLKAMTMLDGQYPISINTVGGKNVVLAASSESERQEWMQAIESNKYTSLSRRLEDVEAMSVQTTHRVEQQEIQNTELDAQLREARRLLTISHQNAEKASLSMTKLENEVVLYCCA